MEKLLTPQELAENLGVKISTIYSWTHEKRIPRVSGMRLLRFRESEVEAWLALKQEAKSEEREKPKACLNSHQPAAKTKRLNSHIDKIVERAKSEGRG